MNKFFYTILFLLLLSLNSCSSLRSGQYVQISENMSLEAISANYKISKQHLFNENPGNTFALGDWVFVPQKRGIIGQSTYEKRRIYSGQMLWPVPVSKRVSSKYGRRWGKRHEGIDIPAKRGSSILSVDDGVIVHSGGGFGGYGNVVVISHRGGIFTVYAHVQKIFVGKGQKVSKGQVIATVGNSGRSTGPHLHFEIRKNSEAIDPKKYLSFN